MSKPINVWKGEFADEVMEFDATEMLHAPFKVVLKNSVKQLLDKQGNVVETFVPDPVGLIKAVAQARALHPHKLNAAEVKFIRSALGLKAIELAKAIAVTPEYLSRVERGKGVLSPQSEKLVRIYTHVMSLPEHSKKNIAVMAKQVGLVFGSKKIKSCHVIDDDIVVELSRVLFDSSDDLNNEAWDSTVPSDVVA